MQPHPACPAATAAAPTTAALSGCAPGPSPAARPGELFASCSGAAYRMVPPPTAGEERSRAALLMVVLLLQQGGHTVRTRKGPIAAHTHACCRLLRTQGHTLLKSGQPPHPCCPHPATLSPGQAPWLTPRLPAWRAEHCEIPSRWYPAVLRRHPAARHCHPRTHRRRRRCCCCVQHLCRLAARAGSPAGSLWSAGCSAARGWRVQAQGAEKGSTHPAASCAHTAEGSANPTRQCDPQRTTSLAALG